MATTGNIKNAELEQLFCQNPHQLVTLFDIPINSAVGLGKRDSTGVWLGAPHAPILRYGQQNTRCPITSSHADRGVVQKPLDSTRPIPYGHQLSSIRYPKAQWTVYSTVPLPCDT